MLDIGLDGGSILDCRLRIGRGDESIILTIDSKPNPNFCSFFVLRPTEWRQTVSLWLRTSFVIWRQMWGETRGRWEGSPVGKFLEQVSKFGFFCGFPATYRFWNFGFFLGFPRFLGDPKKSQNTDFSAVSRDFEGWACPKFFAVFLRWTGLKIWIFPWYPAIFRGPKNSQNTVFPRGFSGFRRTGLSKIFQNLDFPAVFLQFWRVGPTQKNSEPTNLSVVFLGF